MKRTSYPHEAQFRIFLRALGEGPWTFQTFGEGAALGDRGLARILHGGATELFPELARLNEAGAGVFVTVNRTDGKGRRRENVVAVRALFLDLDGSPLEPVLERMPRPTMIVETSPGRFHVYWRVTSLPLSIFSLAQKRLAQQLGGDPACHDLGRVMRVPGFWHRKGDAPFPSRLVSVSYRVCEPEELERALPGLLDPPPDPQPRALKPIAPPSPDDPLVRKRFHGLLRWAQEKVVSAPAGSRHVTLYRTARLVGGWAAMVGVPLEEVVAVLAQAALASGLPEVEAVRTARDGAQAGAAAPLPLP